MLFVSRPITVELFNLVIYKTTLSIQTHGDTTFWLDFVQGFKAEINVRI